MKKLIFLLSLVLPVYALAQQDSARVQRYTYELKYRLDSTDTAKVIAENFFLDVASDNSSRFTSEGKLVGDSVIRYWKKQLAAGAKSININKTVSSKYNFEIVRGADGVVTYRENIGAENYYYIEDLSKIIWNILPGFEEYHGMKTQKAVTHYGGRDWRVLFTSEIPLMDGPYKFKNLPGFVVKAWDGRGHYIFSFVESKNVLSFYDLTLPGNTMKISKQQLAKAIANYRIKPFGGTNFIIEGKEVPAAVFEKKRIEKLKKENNWIELAP